MLGPNYSPNLIKTPDWTLNNPPSFPLTGDRASFLDNNPFSESDEDTINDTDENRVLTSKIRLRIVSSSSNSEGVGTSQVKDERQE